MPGLSRYFNKKFFVLVNYSSEDGKKPSPMLSSGKSSVSPLLDWSLQSLISFFASSSNSMCFKVIPLGMFLEFPPRWASQSELLSITWCPPIWSIKTQKVTPQKQSKEWRCSSSLQSSVCLSVSQFSMFFMTSSISSSVSLYSPIQSALSYER